ncbi:glycoside hydrolase family 3 C-terminal domain-containing protein [Pseudonocardia yunnanensis]|uniref:Beta-glucosidase n=2 Tax=Pseudonocardia yunnanensis TaxID=58107 RepID=A0ABW4F023_9PSEU
MAADSTVPPQRKLVDEMRRLVAALAIEDRVRLLTGATAWTLHELPSIGLRSLAVSDGPIGVRGTGDSLPSAQMPAPSAMAATWDEEVLGALGVLMASEARRKQVDVVLAPVVNLQRTPVGGRHFECFSEDPLLTGLMAVAFVRAVQAAGVGACVKHYLGNESETDRTSYIARIDRRTMREVYLAPFERVVLDAGVWTVMAAYNGLDDGTESGPATEHHGLLTSILKQEWGFEGLVMSDWQATKTTEESALAGLDLVMPGPGGPWGEALLAAVRSGRVPESVVDDKVARVLAVAQRAGALSGRPGQIEPYRVPGGLPEPDAPEVRGLLRSVAARSTVVLRNEDALLPVVAEGLRTIALIGDNALDPFVQGGGSAHVVAPHQPDLPAALREAFPTAEVTAHPGGATRRHLPLALHDVVPGGFTVRALDAAGGVLEERHHDAPWDGWLRALPTGTAEVTVGADLRLAEPGRHVVELCVVGAHRASVGQALVSASDHRAGSEVVLDGSAGHPAGTSHPVDVASPATVPVTATLQVVDAAGFGRFARLEVRHRAPSTAPTGDELTAAVQAARAADLAVVVVGTNPEVESEGWDRRDLALPGAQDEFVRRVAAANPRTVVVVNAGAPVLLPWLDEVPAVLWWWLPGQEGAGALADVLAGAVEPGGRLPWTLPASAEDVPVPDAVPVDGVVRYAEGTDVGHRAWDRLGRSPAREFGFGLGYGAWEYGEMTAGAWSDSAGVIVTVEIANVADRPSREVVQVYLEPPAADPRRPVRWLGGFTGAEVAPGERASVQVAVPPRAFQVWDEDGPGWRTPAGRYRLRAGRSSRDLRATTVVDVPLT